MIKRLWKEYMVTPNDIVWANYVHLICVQMVEKHPWKKFWFYVRTAIEWLTIDMKIKHPDPYELWIDAWYLDKKLNAK